MHNYVNRRYFTSVINLYLSNPTVIVVRVWAHHNVCLLYACNKHNVYVRTHQCTSIWPLSVCNHHVPMCLVYCNWVTTSRSTVCMYHDMSITLCLLRVTTTSTYVTTACNMSTLCLEPPHVYVTDAVGSNPLSSQTNDIKVILVVS